jgi:hypothetical protein
VSEQEAKQIARIAGLKRGDVVNGFVVIDNKGNVRRRDALVVTDHEADPCGKGAR